LKKYQHNATFQPLGLLYTLAFIRM